MAHVERNPKILGGEACFAGTRVPVRSLFDHLKRGYSIDEFLTQFPTVSREQAEGVLDEAGGRFAPDSRRAAG